MSDAMGGPRIPYIYTVETGPNKGSKDGRERGPIQDSRHHNVVLPFSPL